MIAPELDVAAKVSLAVAVSSLILLGIVIRVYTPPMCILLGASRNNETETASAALTWIFFPFLIGHLLARAAHDTTDAEALRWRTLDDDEWEKQVERLSVLATITIIDCRALTPFVQMEIERHLDERFASSSYFLCADTGACEHLQSRGAPRERLLIEDDFCEHMYALRSSLGHMNSSITGVT